MHQTLFAIMDVIETLDAIFEQLLPDIIKCHGDTTKIQELLESTKYSVMCISACNPMNTEYILDALTPSTNNITIV